MIWQIKQKCPVEIDTGLLVSPTGTSLGHNFYLLLTVQPTWWYFIGVVAVLMRERM